MVNGSDQYTVIENATDENTSQNPEIIESSWNESEKNSTSDDEPVKLKLKFSIFLNVKRKDKPYLHGAGSSTHAKRVSERKSFTHF